MSKNVIIIELSKLGGKLMKKLSLIGLLLACLVFVGCAVHRDEAIDDYDYIYALDSDYIDSEPYASLEDNDYADGHVSLFELNIAEPYYLYDDYSDYEEETQIEMTKPEPTTQAPVTTVAVTPIQTTPTPTTPEPTTESALTYNFIGNINSLIFHLLTCDTLPMYQNRIYFITRYDAIEGGHRACLRCNP